MLSDSLSASTVEPVRILLRPKKSHPPLNYTPEFTSDSERRLAEELEAAVSMEQELADNAAPVKEEIIPPPPQTEIDHVFHYAAGRIAMYLLAKTANNRALADSALEDTATSDSWKLDARGQAFYAQVAESMRVMVSDRGVVVYDGTTRFVLGSGGYLFNKLRTTHPEADVVLKEQEEIGESLFAIHVDVNEEPAKPKEPDDSDLLFELLGIDEDAFSVCRESDVNPSVLREVIPPMTLEEESHLFEGYYSDPALEIRYEDEFEQRIAEVKKEETPAPEPEVVAVAEAKAEEEPMKKEEPKVAPEPVKDEPKKYAREVWPSPDEKQTQITGTQHYLKSVQGRVLTIMEAAFPDKEQRDAIKTLIKKEFRREMDKVHRHVTFNEGEAGEESD